MHKDKKVIYHYLITYIVVMLIPLIICASYYAKLVSVISEDDIRENQVELQHTAVLVDQIVEEFSYAIDTLILNKKIISFKNVEESFLYPNSYQIIELWDALPDLYQINQSIFGFYIFFDNSEMVISKEMAYEYEKFYELYLQDLEYATYEEWYQALLSNNNSGLLPVKSYIYMKAEEINLITYTSPLLGYDGKKCGTIEILLEESELELLMPSMTEDGIQYIEDASGNIIYSRSDMDIDITSLNQKIIEKSIKNGKAETIKIDYKSYKVIQWQSELSGLTFYYLEPSISVNSRQLTISMVLIFLISIAMTVGVILSYYMSIKTAKPINALLNESIKEFEKYEKQPFVFSNLTKVFSDLNQRNTVLANALEQQTPYIKNAFFNKLIHGNFIAEEEWEKISHYIDINVKDKTFWIVIMRFIIDPEETKTEKETLISACILSGIEAIEKSFPEALYTNEGGEQVTFMLAASVHNHENLRKDVESRFEQMKEMMPPSISERMVIYCGNEVRNLTDLYESYNNASFIHNSGLWKARLPINWYEVSENEELTYPSTDLAVKLTHYVTSGDISGLHDALGEIMKLYLIDNNLPTYLQHMVLNELQIVLFRILGRIGIKEGNYDRYYNKLEENHNAPLITQITTTLNLYREVCDFVAKQKDEADTTATISSIVSYIDLNYGDQNISLASIADMFHMNESYLSSMFKQSLDIKFSTYIEELRISKAKELLKTTNLTIGDIGQQVGYYSTNSFCRAFKRTSGVSASEYRKNE